ncbi:cysteine sulfinic acid decarboxylase [Megalopta genalis]|uniref:cysteine sulfinic acid decarboxylase n=1 Tax=Megalopta genalis TaxID=115081 RepID=UPI003FD31F1B
MEGSRSTDGTSFELLSRLLEILREENAFNESGDEPVVRFVQPEELRNRMPMDLDEEPATKEEIETAVRQTIRYSVKTTSPHFHNQLYAGIEVYGLAGSWLTDVLNTSQYTYEVSPVFTLMERQVIGKSLKLFGYPQFPEGDGIFCPGGSISAMYGMAVARFNKFPDVKRKGLAGLPPLACFTSEAGHYSITKGAHWLGLGTDHVYKVETDELGRMRPDKLSSAIAEARKQGNVPFFVNATCGTTVLGSFDPLPEIAAICKKEDLWLHVDACLGGTLLLSEKYRARLKGVELSNSVAWNPHKMLGAPFQCSMFLTKGKNLMHETNCAGAKYLFQQDKHYDVSWDTGDKSLQCGRKVDTLKLWLMWKARGTRGLRESVDTAMHAAEYFFERIKNREGFRLVLPSYECCNICFWYVPPSMRGQEETQDWWNKLYRITAKIKELMMLDGSLMIGYTPLTYKNHGNFFRMVVTCQPPKTEASMDFAIDKLEQLARDL